MLKQWASTTYFCQLLEAVLVCVLFAGAFLYPRLGASWFERIECILHRLSLHRVASLVGLAVSVVVVRLLLVQFLPPPEPLMQDEFSYLLAGETFADERVTNLPDPFWPHFESVHILQQPTYMSMYPPGQGLFLAAGILIAKSPWAGVMLSVALLFPALYWAIEGWMPGRWALAISLLGVVRWGVASYWMNSYWGGAVSALGGALIFGAVPRLAKGPNKRNVIILSCGIVLLANTRPYEGSAVILSSLFVLGAWLSRTGCVAALRRPRIWVPAITILLTAGAAMFYYDYRVTSKAFVLPYILDREEYAIAPLFVWQHLRPEPRYNSASLREVYVEEVKRYSSARAWMGIPEALRKLKNIWVFYFGSLLSIPLIAFLFIRKDCGAEEERKRQYVTIVLLVLLLALFGPVWFYPHYAAPGFAAFACMLAMGFRRLRRWQWRDRPLGIFFCRMVPVGCLVMAVVPIAARPLGYRLSMWPLQWAVAYGPGVQTEEVKSQILSAGPRALVFIQYGPSHDPADEWVYNAPVIQQAPIIWARKINPASDAALIRHFADRTVWLVQTDSHPIKVSRAPDSVHSTGFWDKLN